MLWFKSIFGLYCVSSSIWCKTSIHFVFPVQTSQQIWTLWEKATCRFCSNIFKKRFNKFYILICFENICLQRQETGNEGDLLYIAVSCKKSLIINLYVFPTWSSYFFHLYREKLNFLSKVSFKKKKYDTPVKNKTKIKPVIKQKIDPP